MAIVRLITIKYFNWLTALINIHQYFNFKGKLIQKWKFCHLHTSSSSKLKLVSSFEHKHIFWRVSVSKQLLVPIDFLSVFPQSDVGQQL